MIGNGREQGSYIFVSYCRKDGRYIYPLIDMMRKNGYAIWYDADIRLGEQWTDELASRIAKCTVFLAFSSQHFNSSPHCMQELRFAKTKRRAIVLARIDDTCLPDNLKFLVEDYQELRINHADFLSSFLEKIKREPLFRVCQTSNMVKAENKLKRAIIVTCEKPAAPSSSFIGRAQIMDRILSIIKERTSLILRGMGGIGKSEICRKLFYDFTKGVGNDIIRQIGWVMWRGSAEETFYRQFRTEFVADEADAIVYWNLACRYMDTQGEQLLMIIDNADDLTQDDIAVLSKLQCRLLITSRRANGSQFCAVDAGKLNKSECRILYRNSLHQDDNLVGYDDSPDDNLDSLLELANYHTLTITLLAKTQRANWLSTQELLEKVLASGFDLSGANIDYLHHPEQLKSDVEEQTFIEHMSRVFDLSPLRANQKEGGEALKVLQGMSLLSPSVPIHGRDVIQWLGLNSFNGLNDAIKWGWLERQNETVSIHPVVASVIRHSAMPDSSYVNIIADALYENMFVDDLALFTDKLPLLTHAVALEHSVCHLELCSGSYGKMLHQIGFLLCHCGRYEAALKYLLKAVGIEEKTLIEDKYPIARTYNMISACYRHLGNYSSALDWVRKAKSILDEAQIPDSSHISLIYNNIGEIHRLLGESEASISWCKKVLEMQKEFLPKDHPRIAVTYNTIGLAYYDQGNFKEALEWLHKSRCIREKVLKADHPNNATTYHNIGLTYYAVGEYSKAKIWFERALSIRTRCLGKEHPHTEATQKLLDMSLCKLSEIK